MTIASIVRSGYGSSPSGVLTDGFIGGGSAAPTVNYIYLTAKDGYQVNAGGAVSYATNQNGTIIRNQDAVVVFTLYGVDASGWGFEYTIRLGKSTAALLTKTSGITATYDGTNSTISVPVTAAQSDVAPHTYNHALLRTGSGTQYPLATGALTVRSSSHAI